MPSLCPVPHPELDTVQRASPHIEQSIPIPSMPQSTLSVPSIAESTVPWSIYVSSSMHDPSGSNPGVSWPLYPTAGQPHVPRQPQQQQGDLNWPMPSPYGTVQPNPSVWQHVASQTQTNAGQYSHPAPMGPSSSASVSAAASLPLFTSPPSSQSYISQAQPPVVRSQDVYQYPPAPLQPPVSSQPGVVMIMPPNLPLPGAV